MPRSEGGWAPKCRAGERRAGHGSGPGITARSPDHKATGISVCSTARAQAKPLLPQANPQANPSCPTRPRRYELPSAKLLALLDQRVAFLPEVLPWLAPEVQKGTASVTEKAGDAPRAPRESRQAAGSPGGPAAALQCWSGCQPAKAWRRLGCCTLCCKRQLSPTVRPCRLNSATRLPPSPRQVDVFSMGILLWQLWARRSPYDSLRFAILADSMRGSGVVMRPIIPDRTSTPEPGGGPCAPGGLGWEVLPAVQFSLHRSAVLLRSPIAANATLALASPHTHASPPAVPGWRRLMERCWAEDPQQRPSFAEVAQELQALLAYHCSPPRRSR